MKEDPPFLLGIMVQDALFFFYIISHEYEDIFFIEVLKIYKILKDLHIFSFSNYEQDVLNKILQKSIKNGKNDSKDNTVSNIKIYNIQERNYESMFEALVHLGFQTSEDILSRKGELIEYLFDLYEENNLLDDIYINIIIEHNKICLLNSALIFVYRYLKKIK